MKSILIKDNVVENIIIWTEGDQELEGYTHVHVEDDDTTQIGATYDPATNTFTNPPIPDWKEGLDNTALRRLSYPDFRDYLDGIVKGDEAQIQAYIDACLAVKAKYPKEQ